MVYSNKNESSLINEAHCSQRVACSCDLPMSKDFTSSTGIHNTRSYLWPVYFLLADEGKKQQEMEGE